MSLNSQIHEVQARLEASFDEAKKTLKPFATAAVSEATLKGLRKGISMFFDCCNTAIKDLQELSKQEDGASLLTQLKAENGLLGGKVQSLAFAVQEAEGNLSKQRASFEEEMSKINEAHDILQKRNAILEQENSKIKEIEQVLQIERAEKNAAQRTLQNITEDFTVQRNEWQNKLAQMMASKWEEQHLLYSQKSSESALRAHLEELTRENAHLRTIKTDSTACASVSTRLVKGNSAAIDVLRDSLAKLQTDYDALAEENRRLVQDKEKTSSVIISHVKLPSPSQQLPRSFEPVVSSPRVSVAEYRHASIQTDRFFQDDLERTVQALKEQASQAVQQRIFLENELQKMSFEMAEDGFLREKVAWLETELKRKSFRISRLVGELDAQRSSQPTGLQIAFEQSQKARAAAELEVLAQQKHISYLESRRPLVTSGSVSLFEKMHDPLTALHRDTNVLNLMSKESQMMMSREEEQLRSDLEYAQSAAEYWDSQPHDEVSNSMRDDAALRLEKSRAALRKFQNKKDAELEDFDAMRRQLVGEENNCLRI